MRRLRDLRASLHDGADLKDRLRHEVFDGDTSREGREYLSAKAHAHAWLSHRADGSDMDIKEFCADFERAIHPGRSLNAQDRTGRERVSVNGRVTYGEKHNVRAAVFVEIIEATKSLQRRFAGPIWLMPVNDLDGIRVDSVEPTNVLWSVGGGIRPCPLAVANRELKDPGNRLRWPLLVAGDVQLVNKVVKRRTRVVQDVSDPAVPMRRYRRQLRDLGYDDVLSCLVTYGPHLDQIRFSLEGGAHFRNERLEVLVGSVEPSSALVEVGSHRE